MNEYKKKYNIKFPILYGNIRIVEEYHIEHGVPAFFFIDKNGMVKKVLFGETTLEVMEELVDGALKPIITEEAK